MLCDDLGGGMGVDGWKGGSRGRGYLYAAAAAKLLQSAWLSGWSECPLLSVNKLSWFSHYSIPSALEVTGTSSSRGFCLGISLPL